MPTATMPAGGGVQVNGQWYTMAEYQAAGGTTGHSGGGGSTSAMGDPATLDGKQVLQDFLNQYGLSGINLSQAWTAYVNSGSNMDYWSNTWLPQQAAFKSAYPAYQTLMQQGRGLTVQQYRDYQNTVYAEAQQAGFPQGTITQNTITSWLEGDVSASEAQSRIQDASKAVYQLDKNSQDYFALREAGIHDGDLAAVWFDPTTALPLLENKLAAAQIGGAAANAGIQLGTGLAAGLQAQGVSGAQAQNGFNVMARSQQLFGALPGGSGSTLTQDQQAGGVFGTDSAAAQQLAQTTAQRTAAFQGGGSFTASSGGVSGIGKAQGA